MEKHQPTPKTANTIHYFVHHTRLNLRAYATESIEDQIFTREKPITTSFKLRILNTLCEARKLMAEVKKSKAINLLQSHSHG
jgi:hypothetical protein